MGMMNRDDWRWRHEHRTSGVFDDSQNLPHAFETPPDVLFCDLERVDDHVA